MRYPPQNHDDQPGQDSFLDIVANMVGILIILVTVVGVRAAHAPRIPPPDPNPPIDADRPVEEAGKSAMPPEQLAEQCAAARKRVVSLQRDITNAARQVLHAEHEISQRDAERTRLQSAITMLENELAELRNGLDATQRDELDLQTRINEARTALKQLAREQYALELASDEVETIVSLPTPLAKTVRGDEVHIRLANGRISIVPIDTLVALFERDVESKLWKLKDRDELIETVGPVGGFRLRYRIARQTCMVPASGGVQHQTMVQLDQWEVLPVAEDLGIPMEQAWLAGSDLQKALAGRSPESTAVTIWTYPDSFTHFRALKKALFDRGYATAARPLPDGIRIGGSPRGTKSSVQ